MKRVSLLFLLALVLGCAPVLKLPDLQTVSHGNLPEWVPVSSLFPQEFNATQRLLLTANGKEYDFTGSLQKERQEIRAIALAEMGSLFLYLRIRGNQTEIVKNPSGLPENPLRDGVAGDIRFLFDQDTMLHDWKWRQNTARRVVVQRKGERQIVWQADSAGQRVNLITEARNGRKVRTARFSDYRYFDLMDKTLPATIVIQNFRWHYTLRVQLLTIHPLKPETS